jgi:hypothetical protein
LFEYPSAILCGESVLHAAGWITQIPAQLSVTVLSRPSYVSLHGFEIRGRPLQWFRKVHSMVDASVEKRIMVCVPHPLRWQSPICTLIRTGGIRIRMISISRIRTGIQCGPPSSYSM